MRKVKIQRKEYRSLAEVAREFDTSVSTVRKLIAEGTIDRIAEFVVRQSNRRQPVSHNGTIYPSLGSAAKALGTSIHRIQRLLDAGLPPDNLQRNGRKV